MIKKMMKKDILLLVLFLAISLLMVGFGAYQAVICTPTAWRIVIIGAVAACLTVLTVCFVTIGKHLRENAAEVYKDEADGAESGEALTKFLIVADILFVLVLCFVVLLSTMLITKRLPGWSYVQHGYRIQPLLVLGVFGSIGGYLVYLVKRSLRCYDEVEEAYYTAKEKGEI